MNFSAFTKRLCAATMTLAVAMTCGPAMAKGKTCPLPGGVQCASLPEVYERTNTRDSLFAESERSGGDAHTRLDDVEVALAPLFLQMDFELARTVKVVLDPPATGACHEDDFVDPRGHRFFDEVLNDRFVDDRQEFLGDGLRGGKKPGSVTGDGDYGLSDSLCAHPEGCLEGGADCRNSWTLRCSSSDPEGIASSRSPPHPRPLSREGRGEKCWESEIVAGSPHLRATVPLSPRGRGVRGRAEVEAPFRTSETKH